MVAFEQSGVINGVGGADILDNPTSLQFGPDGRLYVAEQVTAPVLSLPWRT